MLSHVIFGVKKHIFKIKYHVTRHKITLKSIVTRYLN
jgi:hypothetical protein